VLQGALESGKSGGVLLCGGGVLDFAKCQTNLIHDNWAASPKMWHHRVPHSLSLTRDQGLAFCEVHLIELLID
jgi:hypothetical protein